MPRRLHGPRALARRRAARRCCWRSCSSGPLVQLVACGRSSRSGEGAAAGDLAARRAHDLAAGRAIAALVAAVAATVVVYGRRTRPSRVGALTARLGTLGYAVPGTVVAVAVYIPLAWLDRRLADGGRESSGSTSGCCSPGTIARPRRSPTSCASRRSRSSRSTRACGGVDPALDDAARSLGADRHARALRRPPAAAVAGHRDRGAARVRRGDEGAAGDRAAAAARRRHARDRGLGGHASDSRFEVAALPALLIVAVGLVPVVLVIRFSRGGAATLVGANADGGDQRSDLDPRG